MTKKKTRTKTQLYKSGLTWPVYMNEEDTRHG